ncbi:MAG: glutathione synthase [Deltaproteobacteria bacterium]|nr:glutathione synthase [Deltaproteobacteria bacterium]
MRLLFVMDPIETMLPDKDTTFALMRAAQAAGHQNLHCLVRDLWVEQGRVHARVTTTAVCAEPPYAVHGDRFEVALGQVDAVLVRKDPPFDAAYLHCTQMLECERGRTLIVNDPRGLRDANEKLCALLFPEWTPRTIVSSDRTRIRAFVDSVGGLGIIKPLDGAGGRGVLRIAADDLNTPSIIDMLTDEGRELAMVQEYLPAVREGDKRVLLLDGKLLGAILRVPRADDLRANIHVGGTVIATTLTDREQRLVEAIGPRLREMGLFFVGLDMIGERLTEVNVTSPTGIQELGRLTGTAPEAEVIRWIERRVARD